MIQTDNKKLKTGIDQILQCFPTNWCQLAQRIYSTIEASKKFGMTNQQHHTFHRW
jgi:hypothetical protein